MHGAMTWNDTADDQPTLALFLGHLRRIVNLAGIDHGSSRKAMAALASSQAESGIVATRFGRHGGQSADHIHALATEMGGAAQP
jgi:hypothetical protein